VALALIETGQVRLGVLGCPNLDLPGVPGFQPPGALFLAVSSEGTWQTGMPVGRTADFYAGQFSRLEVSSQSDPAQARLLRSFEASHTNVQKLDQLLHQLNVKPEPLRLDSQVKYALLAAGKADAMVRPQPASDPSYHEKVWDHAAGSLVVEEAGGQVTDLDGMKLDLTTGRFLARNRGILVTNEHLHPAFLSAVKATGL
jgi:3'(2'), 5'-bisphosphate nucleotidase